MHAPLNIIISPLPSPSFLFSLPLSLIFFLPLLFLSLSPVSPVVNESQPIVRVVEGDDAIFQCAAVSEPVHITHWQFNGNNLINSSKHSISGVNTVRSTLTVVNVTLLDEGNYTCRVSNIHGVDFAPSDLQIQGDLIQQHNNDYDDNGVCHSSTKDHYAS